MFYKALPVQLAAALAVPVVIAGAAAEAASYNIINDGSSALLGTFDAPTTGGAITSISVSVGGVTYDSLGTGSQSPTYNAATNDLGGAGGVGLGAVYNSVASGICGIGECAFSFFPIFDFVTPIPGEWYADKVAPGQQQSLGFGHYRVVPAIVPAPPSILAMLAAIAALAGLARRRRRRTGIVLS